MKVQMQNQSVRLRVSEAELVRLLEGKTVCNRTHWPDGRHSVQELVLAGEDAWHMLEHGWQARLEAAAVRELASRLPSRDGLRRHFVTPAGESLELRFDVDAHDPARRRRKEPHA